MLPMLLAAFFFGFYLCRGENRLCGAEAPDATGQEQVQCAEVPLCGAGHQQPGPVPGNVRDDAGGSPGMQRGF